MEVPVGNDIIIDISSLPPSSAITCNLYLDDRWDRNVHICTTIPMQYPCNPHTQYQGRSTYTNETTLLITGVLKNESVIYYCRPSVGSGIIIPGVIIVGMFNCLNYFS